MRFLIRNQKQTNSLLYTRHQRRLLFVSAVAVMLLFASFTSNRTSLPASQASEESPLELDHVFVWVTKEAPEAKALEKAGLQIFGGTHKHDGQGTASRTFIFENVYLELIWIDDAQAAAKNATRSGIDMTKRARWKTTGASPFGVGLHRRPGNDAAIPFPVRLYWAEWMKPDTVIEFAQTVTSLSEPMYFVVPEYISIANPVMRERLTDAVKHPLGVSRLSNLRIVTTGKKQTSTSELLSQAGIVRVEQGKTPLLELTFDGGSQNKIINLRPQLPVVLKY